MSTRILPVIGSTGTYELLPPFNTHILAEELYTCKAIRNISEYVSYNQDAKKLVYDYYGLTEEDYENDIKEDMEIVSLQNNKGVWIYVPARYIIKYPEVDGVPYHQVSLVCKLPAIEVSKNLEFLKTNIVNLVKDTLGLEPALSLVEASRTIAVTKQMADNLTIQRAALTQGKITDRARYLDLLQKQQTLIEKIKTLEEYIKSVNGVFRLDGPNRVVKGSIVPYKIIGFDSHAIYNVSVSVGEVEVNGRFITYLAPDEVATAVITVNNIDFIVSVLEETPNIKTPIIHILNDITYTGPDVGFITDTFTVLFIQDTHIASDWEVATDANFTDVISSVYGSAIYKTNYIVTDLQPNRTYYVRARFYGAEVTASEWGVLDFNTRSSFIDKPTITQPADNSDNLGPNITFVSDEFSVTHGTDIHQSTVWQIATDVDFTDVVAGTEQTGVDLTSFTANDLLANRTYYVRVKYIGYTKGSSEWSNVVTIRTLDTYVVKPTMVLPVNGTVGLGPKIELLSSNFKTITFSDEHISSDWQVASDINFTDIVFEKLNEVQGKIQYLIERLAPNKTYYARVRHTSESNGTTEWSIPVMFKTKVAYINKPYILNPVTNTENLGPVINFTSSEFKSDDTDTHVSSTWQVSDSENFGTILYGVIEETDSKTSFNVKNIGPNKKYYARVKYKGTSGDWSDWSNICYFFTHGSYIDTPTIITPNYGQVGLGGNVTFITSDFKSIFNQSHSVSDWQISLDKSFASGVNETNTPFLTKFTAKGLLAGKTYYARVRHGSNTTLKSEWSPVIDFTTASNFIEKPVITLPTHGDNNQFDNICFKATPFVSLDSNAHAASVWSIKKKTGSTTTETIVNDLETYEFLTQFNLMNATFNSTYLIKVKYKDNLGNFSEWSETSVFITKADFANSPEYDIPAMT